VLVQYGKLACASFPPQWNDVRDAFVFVYVLAFPHKKALAFLHGALSLLAMCLCLC
jgi:hypothetical protein